MESTRSCRASCVTVARSAVVSGELVAVIGWSSEVVVQVEIAPGGFEETAHPGAATRPDAQSICVSDRRLGRSSREELALASAVPRARHDGRCVRALTPPSRPGCRYASTGHPTI